MNLALVTLEELVDEIANRHDAVVLVTYRNDSRTKQDKYRLRMTEGLPRHAAEGLLREGMRYLDGWESAELEDDD